MSAAVFGDCVSANIVGYLNNATGELESPGIGMVFTPIGNGDTFKLSDISVVGTSGVGYMNPGSEYLQKLDDNTDVEGCYTYISKAYLEKMFPASKSQWKDEYLEAIGWWNWDQSWRTQFKTLIQNGDYGHKCTNAQMTFDIGTAFLANFSGNNGLVFTASGEAPKSKPLNFGELESPFFANFVPRTIDINEIEVVGTSGTGYMNPGSEYLQKLDDNTDVVGCYTYISKAYLEKMFPASKSQWKDEYLEAIGWWNWDQSWRTQFKTLIQNGDYGHKITKFDVNPSDAFLGNFSGNNGLKFIFPDSVKEN